MFGQYHGNGKGIGRALAELETASARTIPQKMSGRGSGQEFSANEKEKGIGGALAELE